MTSSNCPQPGSRLIAIVLCAFIAFVSWQRIARSIVGVPEIKKEWPDMRIDINSAGAPQLDLLPGIGKNLAEAIVEDRRQHGPFESVNDLDRVRLIGPRTVQRLTPFAVVEVIGQHSQNNGEDSQDDVSIEPEILLSEP